MSDVKKKVVILFGGQSSEHDVSCISGATVAEAVDKDKYEVYLLGITKEGRWVLVDSVEDIRSGAWRESGREALIAPSSDRRMLVKDGDGYTEITVDVVFPVLHGLYGEDGTVQGLLKLAHIPFAGCGHLSAAITMDKFFTKVIADSVGVAQAAYEPVRDYELKDMDSVVARVEAFRDYPVFIKPSNAGSSVGITKAHNREELIKGLKLAAENDSKILVEEAINGREIECAVYGYGDNAVAMGLGEIVAAAEFYDFDAKYNNEDSLTIMDPELPEGKAEEIRNKALGIYRACDCFGMARVDFFLENGTNRVVFNEINAIPGHTSISMYPMLMDRAGHKLTDYLDGLIQMAYERHPQKQ